MKARDNNEMQQTKGAKVRAVRHSAAKLLSVPHCTFFINVPSQLISVLGALPGGGE